MRPSSSRPRTRAHSMLLRGGVTILVTLAVVGGLPATFPSAAQDSTTYDFNTPGQLATLFNGVGPGLASVTQETSGGIGDSGAIHVPSSSVNAVFTSKEGYSLGPIGSVYRFSTFIKSTGNGGYSGVGFASASPTSASSVTAYRPDDALGISVHGGGYIFHNGPTNYEGSWGSNASGGLTTVKLSTCHDLINNTTACGSPDQWFQIVFIVERVSETDFDLRVEVWPSDVDGTLRFDEATAIVELNGITNSTILDAPLLHSYFSFSGHRVTRFDDYTVTLSGGATAFAADAPVVLTKSVAVVGNPTVALAGQVTSDRGQSVIERGFVYSTSPNPTVADTRVVLGGGVGDFSGTTALPASGTYYFRSFATNATSTGYGSQVSVAYLASGSSGTSGTGSTGGTSGTQGSVSGGTTAPSSIDASTEVAIAAAQTLTGVQSVLVRDGAIVPTVTSIDSSLGPQGGVVIEDPSGALRVSITAAGGASPTSGVNVAPNGEIVCEVCAQLAMDSVVEAWVYSAPRLAAAIRIETDVTDGGCPLLRIPVGTPLDGGSGIEPGAHTLQLRMSTPTGFEVLAIPIAVGETAGLDAEGTLVPSSIQAGGGPVPAHHMLMNGLLVAVLIAVMALALGGPISASSAIASRVRRAVVATSSPSAGRTLHGFDALDRRLDELRESLRASGRA